MYKRKAKRKALARPNKVGLRRGRPIEVTTPTRQAAKTAHSKIAACPRRSSLLPQQLQTFLKATAKALQALQGLPMHKSAKAWASNLVEMKNHGNEDAAGYSPACSCAWSQTRLPIAVALTSSRCQAAVLSKAAAHDRLQDSSHPLAPFLTYLASGSYGAVFQAKWHDGSEVAMKVQRQEDAKLEVLGLKAAANCRFCIKMVAHAEMDVTWGYGGQFMTTKPEDQTHLHTIVTPLYPRGSLKSLLDKYEKVPFSILKVWLLQMIAAMADFTFFSLAHGDIKLENYLVGDSGNLALADFGGLQTGVRLDKLPIFHREILSMP
ncbi:hypothetical protein WJX84_002293 [Apatococcus fuscideae]|uniref:Protein kinase domain-containing protein n=1 Tax=Apatococcus fuscideae TaxID=2026836 RepID=A0AAW1SSA4_9CHLO